MSFASTEAVTQFEPPGTGPTLAASSSASASSSEPWVPGSPVPGGSPAWPLGPRPLLKTDSLGGKAHLAREAPQQLGKASQLFLTAVETGKNDRKHSQQLLEGTAGTAATVVADSGFPLGPEIRLKLPSPSRPRPENTAVSHHPREQGPWDAKTLHLMSTSKRVQQYLQARDHAHHVQHMVDNDPPSHSNQRKRKKQGTQEGRRLKAAVPTNAFPAIFARSNTLANRFPALTSKG